jgi:putative FmdB family regulatory protein
MPIYDYRCSKGHTFEVMQPVSEEPLANCEVCGRPVKRVLHPPAVHFKGSGFYHTDYGKRRKRSTESSETGSSSEKATESKPAAEKAKPAST